MAFFQGRENRIRCGRCNTEFDLDRNPGGCPLCGFGIKSQNSLQEIKGKMYVDIGQKINYLSIPLEIKLPSGKIQELNIVGAWGMFNDFFSGKALLRVATNIINEKKVEYIKLEELIEKAKMVIVQNNLSELKGFPNNIATKPSSISRLVYHFLLVFASMGLFETKQAKESEKNMWNDAWENILVRPTKEGLEFARLKNKIFDDKDYENQILSEEEKNWLIKYLQEIDKKGYKEYSFLLDMLNFLKEKKRSKEEIIEWLMKNEKLIKYTKSWSHKKDKPKEFAKQIKNIAATFMAGKISLLRELGVISNKRNDYTVIGELGGEKR